MGDGRYPPNRQLAWERLQRGWSYEELTTRIRQAMLDCREVDTGLTANTVRRWEVGQRHPEPRFRKHLVTILGKPADELGLLTPEETSMRPTRDGLDQQLQFLVSGAAQPSMTRADFLTSALTVGVIPLTAIATQVTGSELPARPLRHDSVHDKRAADAYVTMVAAQRDLYWLSAGRSLLECAYSQTMLGIRLLRETAAHPTRTELAIAVGQSALLCGRLAFFDLHRPALAERCYDVALDASREAGDHALAATVLGHMAFAPAFGRRTADALHLVDAAHQHCWHGVSRTIRSWLHCVAAETIARSDSPAAYADRIRLAEDAIAAEDAPPMWFDFYDAGRLDGFAGQCALAADDRPVAAERLHHALEALAPTAAKQRTVLLADLSAAHQDDPTHAEALAHQALDELEKHWYATGYARIADVARALRPGAGRDGVMARVRPLAGAQSSV